MIRILIVDDHTAFRQPLGFLFDQEPDFKVVAQAGSLDAAQAHLDEIDVAVIDMDLPDGRGIELIETLRRVNPHCKPLVLTGSAPCDELAHALQAGAAGLLRKTARIDEIIAAVRMLGTGQPLPPSWEIVGLLQQAYARREHERGIQHIINQLTAREHEVLQALSDGLTDKQIAARLNVSSETIRTHMANILAKLGVESRLQALVWAIRHGIIKITSL